MEPAVLVTGMHRSGTSGVARLLAENGLSVGDRVHDLIEPSASNPLGHYELRSAVVLNAALLNALGGLWDLPPTFAQVESRVEDMVGLVGPDVTAALEGLRREGRPLVKDPRMCLVLPVWLSCEPAAEVVLCVRNPVAVARSLERRDGSSLAFGLAVWELHNLAALRWAPADQTTVVDVDRLRSDASLRRELVLSLRGGTDWVDAFEPELLQPVEEGWEQHLSAQQGELYAHLLGQRPAREWDPSAALEVVRTDRAHIDPAVRQGW